MRNYETSNNPSEGTSSNNLETLGFVLKCPPTGTDNFVLKARTFYQGKQSTVAVVYFKIVQKNQEIQLVWNGKDSNGNDLSSGIYLYHLLFENRLYETKKVVIIR